MMIHVRGVLFRIGHDVHDSSELGNRPGERWPEPLVVYLFVHCHDDSARIWPWVFCLGMFWTSKGGLHSQDDLPHLTTTLISLLIFSWTSTCDTALHFLLADEHAPGGISGPVAMLHY